jgi:hypothetical protein
MFRDLGRVHSYPRFMTQFARFQGFAPPLTDAHQSANDSTYKISCGDPAELEIITIVSCTNNPSLILDFGLSL